MKRQVTHTGGKARPIKRKILVISNGIIEGETLSKAIGLQSGEEQRAALRVIAPALNSRVRHWLSDEDEARRSAALRLAAGLASLSAAGIEADGQVGDADPIQAADALYQFGPEEIVIVSEQRWLSHWQTRDLVGRAQRRFAQAVMDVLIEPSEGAKTKSASWTSLRQPPDNRTTGAAAKATAHRSGPLDHNRIAANG